MGLAGDWKKRQSTWLARMGLKRGVPDPGEWVRVAVVGTNTHNASRHGDRIVAKLMDGGIEAEHHRFVLPDGNLPMSSTGPDAASRIRCEVLVRYRDAEKASGLLREFRPDPIDDEELSRQAMEASRSTGR